MEDLWRVVSLTCSSSLESSPVLTSQLDTDALERELSYKEKKFC